MGLFRKREMRAEYANLFITRRRGPSVSRVVFLDYLVKNENGISNSTGKCKVLDFKMN